MKKLFSSILVLGLLFGGNAYAENIVLSCSFDKVYSANLKDKNFGKTYTQSDLSAVYKDIYAEIKFVDQTLISIGTNSNLTAGELKEAIIDDAYFLFVYKSNAKGIYDKIYIDRYTGKLKVANSNKNDDGYEFSRFYNCQKKAKKF